MTKEKFDKELEKINKFEILFNNIKKQETLSLKKGSNTKDKIKNIEENIKNIEEILTRLSIMKGLIHNVQIENTEEEKSIVYNNCRSMLKNIKDILAN